MLRLAEVLGWCWLPSTRMKARITTLTSVAREAFGQVRSDHELFS